MVYAGNAAAFASRCKDRMHGTLRQLSQQSLESGSREGGPLGRTELRRDDGGLFRSGLRRAHAGEGTITGQKRRSYGRVCSLIAFLVIALGFAPAAPGRRRLLVIGEEKGYRHESITHAMATIERLGMETNLWDTTIRTDTEALTKQKLEYNAKNLNDFDAVLFYTGGDLEMDAQKKADFLSFIHDDGKGFIGVHRAAITFTSWPEYGEMIGGYFDEHPWGTFDAPIVVEDPSFPGMQQWPREFVLRDEI